MNRNQSRGTAKQVGGAIKDAVGKATRTRSLQGEGKIDKVVGKVQKKVGDVKSRSDRERAIPQTNKGL